MRRACLLLAACLAGAALAQPAPDADPKRAAKPAAKAAKAPAKAKSNVRPAWAELTAEQQRILAPLKADWDSIERVRREKWIGIAKRYPAMKPQEQQRVQRQMHAWATLTPEQRRQARENYKKLAKQPPERRERLRQQWAEYQRERQADLPAPVPLRVAPPAEPVEAPAPAAETVPAAQPEAAAQTDTPAAGLLQSVPADR